MQDRADIRRLLIVKMSSIGDVVHALPFATIAKQSDPSLYIGWVVRERCADLVQGHPDVDRLYVVPDKLRVGDLYNLSRELRRDHYDGVMDMQGLLLSGIVAFASGARRRIGLDLNREGNALFLNEPVVPAKERDRHAIDILRGFLAPLGIDRNAQWPVMDFLAKDQTVPGDLQSLPRLVVGLNIGASSVYKQWPADRWTALAKALIAENYTPLLIGGTADVDTAGSIVSAVGHPEHMFNIAGKTTLRQSAAVLKQCEVLVSADTGPLHLAVAVGTPVVALFGPTNPLRTGPYGTRNRIIWKRIACSPCFRHPTCEGRVDCMKAISVDEVLSEVKGMVGEAIQC